MEAFFRHLYETTGFNFSIFYDRGNELRFLRGLGVTFELMAISLLGSLAIGIAGAWLSGSRSRLVAGCCARLHPGASAIRRR